MKWNSFEYAGKTYDLNHLDDLQVSMVIPAQGERPAQAYSIHVIFSLHCFTRGPRKDEPIPKELSYRDNREERIFDFERYEMSHQLPDVIRALGGKRCFHDPHGNFYVVEILEKDGTKKYYAVFFTLSKGGKKKGLNLYVSSAHVRNELPYERNPKPIKFSVLVYNKWRAKQVKPGQ